MSAPMTCPDCGAMLENMGAASRGDGDIFDTFHCVECRAEKYHVHASYCRCGCGGGEVERVWDDPAPYFPEEESLA